ncbi:hypothetical protein FH972_024767 [Carpinus fangiana]|uniref:Uncharacterized protein n=1 Tax=Carpinus fangiana TaxID=176857 RepID=A0A5N6L1I7_9ROSI|nr:hypothetical protein FH972_024767 [Carpinus fangiana]
MSHEDHIWQFNFPNSKFNLEAGDEVEVIADFGDDGDASIDQVVIESKIGLSDDEVESSHGCFDDERGAKRLRCEHNTDDKAETSHGCFDNDREAKRLKCDHSAEMRIGDD